MLVIVKNINSKSKKNVRSKSKKNNINSKSKKKSKRSKILGGAKEKPIIIVGKGVTFDSGGNSIKGSHSMMDMKTDMLGAATVLSVMDYLSKIGCKKNVIGLMPIVGYAREICHKTRRYSKII